MAGDDRVGELGPWSDADLGRTASDEVGVGADAGVPDAARFFAGVVKLIRRRLSTEGADTDPQQPAVFLLAPQASAQGPDVPSARVPMLNNGRTAVTGRLWFVNTVVVSGRCLDLGERSDDELFRYVVDDLQLGSIPAILFDPRTGTAEVRFYPDGLSEPDQCQSTTAASADVSLDRICEAVQRICEACLITPEAQTRAGKLWSDPDRCYAASSAEDVVQTNLKAGLVTAFPTCTIRHEQTDVPGRLDLEIEESDPVDESVVIRHAVLELKVLRSFGAGGGTYSENETREWIESGVRQAAAYRDAKGHRIAVLCCFDMRREDTGGQCFAHVHDLAVCLRVALRRWFIYATSEQYRAAATATA